MREASHDLEGMAAGKYGDLIVKLRSGSHLYGTATPTSDEDIRGVFMPRPDAILAGDFPKVICGKPKDRKNTPEDSDETYVSLHYLVKMLLDGETNATDWLHAPLDDLIVCTPTWLRLVAARSMFYCRSMNGLVGYARKQAAKYGIRGSRIAAGEAALAALRAAGDAKLGDVWESLPDGEHLHKSIGEDGRPVYIVCGKQLQATALARHYIPALEAFLKEYGHRALLAKQNQGVDWKAISHAFRAAYQFRRLLLEGCYSYPLPEAPFLLEVKLGRIDYESVVAPKLEALMEEVEHLSATSPLPDEPDRKGARNWLIEECRVALLEYEF